MLGEQQPQLSPRGVFRSWLPCLREERRASLWSSRDLWPVCTRSAERLKGHGALSPGAPRVLAFDPAFMLTVGEPPS